jgi:hypothetical protein
MPPQVISFAKKKANALLEQVCDCQNEFQTSKFYL